MVYTNINKNLNQTKTNKITMTTEKSHQKTDVGKPSPTSPKELSREEIAKLVAKYGRRTGGSKQYSQFWEKVEKNGYAEIKVDTPGKAAGILKMAKSKGLKGKTKRIGPENYWVIIAKPGTPAGDAVINALNL